MGMIAIGQMAIGLISLGWVSLGTLGAVVSVVWKEGKDQYQKRLSFT